MQWHCGKLNLVCNFSSVMWWHLEGMRNGVLVASYSATLMLIRQAVVGFNWDGGH